MSAKPVHFKAGQFVFREGDTPTCLYIVQTGTLAVRKKKGQGYVELARVHANEVLGELSFFDHQPRSASAIAITNVDALEITFDSIDAIFSKTPSYLRTIVAAIAERLRNANEQLRQAKRNILDEDEGVVSKDDESMSVDEILDDLDDEEL